jgi:hypothetical protein
VDNEEGFRKYTRECTEYFAREYPEHRAFKLASDMDKVCISYIYTHTCIPCVCVYIHTHTYIKYIRIILLYILG